MKKEIGSGVGSGSESISQRYGSGDPDPHQNITDPQHCCNRTSNSGLPDHYLLGITSVPIQKLFCGSESLNLNPSLL